LFGTKEETELVSLYNDATKIHEPVLQEILPAVLPPYLAPKANKRMTLVLDLDETLIHYVEKGDEGKFSI